MTAAKPRPGVGAQSLSRSCNRSRAGKREEKEVIKDLRIGLPVIGYAKIGTKGDPNSRTKGSPVKFDHIELTGRERDSIGRLVPDLPLMRQLLESPGISTCGGCARSKELGFEGGLPTRLPIYLPYRTAELNLPSRWAMYRGRTAFCVGEGEREGEPVVPAQRLEVLQEAADGNPPKFGKPKPFGPCNWDCPDRLARRCKPNTRLLFVLANQQNVGGCYEFRTTSQNSYSNLIGSLKMMEAATNGMLQWIALYFEISPQTVQPADGGRASIAYIARVICPGTIEKLLESVRDTLQVRAPLLREIRQLEAGIEQGIAWPETREEAAEIVAEFYPEEEGVATKPEGPPNHEIREGEQPPQLQRLRQAGSRASAPATRQAEPEDAELVNEPASQAPPATAPAKTTKPTQASWADQAF